MTDNFYKIIYQHVNEIMEYKDFDKYANKLELKEDEIIL